MGTHRGLPVNASHPFCQRLNLMLDESKFDEYLKAICADFYAGEVGRAGLSPGIIFGYWWWAISKRSIQSAEPLAGASDSVSVRSFVWIALDESVSDHSTLARTKRLMDVETHRAVFQCALGAKGATIGMDATTLEANAAPRSVVRRYTGDRYEEFLTRLAKESGIETLTREQLAKLDRKKGSKDDWAHPQIGGALG